MKYFLRTLAMVGLALGTFAFFMSFNSVNALEYYEIDKPRNEYYNFTGYGQEADNTYYYYADTYSVNDGSETWNQLAVYLPSESGYIDYMDITVSLPNNNFPLTYHITTTDEWVFTGIYSYNIQELSWKVHTTYTDSTQASMSRLSHTEDLFILSLDNYMIFANDTLNRYNTINDEAYANGVTDGESNINSIMSDNLVSDTDLDGYDDTSYNQGYNAGYALGINDPTIAQSIEDAYNRGHADGVIDGVDVGVFTQLLDFMGGLFTMPILGPNFTLGMLISIPVGFALFKWLLSMFGVGGK